MKKLTLGLVVVLGAWVATRAQEAGRLDRREVAPQAVVQPAKSRWEYRAMTRFDIVKLAPKPAVGKADGDEPIKGWPVNPNSLSQGLNILGDQGWELVAIEPHFQIPQGDVTAHFGPTYIFRRGK
jgi:hypothetical protein